ncbi:hypothetical protein JB92DRAFT_2575873, partial [Gautieria morchelliformis]
PQPEIGGHRITEDYLEGLSEAECVWRFSTVTAHELSHLSNLLELPGPLITRSGYRATALESLALLCAWLRSPEDLWSLATKYAQPQLAISQIVNETASFINSRWGHLLDWDHEGLLGPANLRMYADALHAFSTPTHSVFGFIDCTIRQTCRPGTNQDLVYTGYKKCHGMKFQGIVV